jgi:hypothetical protein
VESEQGSRTQQRVKEELWELLESIDPGVTRA